jgi:hypothetical protein
VLNASIQDTLAHSKHISVSIQVIFAKALFSFSILVVVVDVDFVV